MLAEAWSTLGAVDRYRLDSETRGLGLSKKFRGIGCLRRSKSAAPAFDFRAGKQNIAKPFARSNHRHAWRRRKAPPVGIDSSRSGISVEVAFEPAFRVERVPGRSRNLGSSSRIFELKTWFFRIYFG